ncbi:MAG TPA: hypothetical protein VF477_08800 [Mycobacterium sp.]
MNDDLRPPRGAPAWRDPLSLSFEGHRRVLLLRLRWHASAADRRTRRQPRRLLGPRR